MRSWVIPLATTLLLVSACTSEPQRREPVVVASAVVPGGAAIVLSPGSPQVCAAVAEATAFRQLPQAFKAMATSEPGAAAPAQITAAAAELRGIDANGDPALATALSDVAGALDAIKVSGLDDPATVDRLVAALTGLSERVQAKCHFPLG